MNSRGFYIALEQRILLDAAGMTTAVETLPDQIDTAVAAAEDAQEQEAVQGLLNAFAEQPTDSSSSETSLIFIDSRVENPEQLLGNSLDKSAEIYIIEEGVDGLAYIAEILGQQEGKVASLHIISHGSSGELLLGSKHITTESLSGDDGQYLAMMSERLDNEADILFYACNVAEGEDGKRFVEKFALITGADVAASTDLTGAESLGGDADLEYTTGNIEAQPVIEIASLANYSELLGTPTAGGNVTLTNTSGGAVSVAEDSSTPSSANVRLTPTTVDDPAVGATTPTEVRIISVTGGTLTQGADGSAITLGAAGTKLTLTSGNYDFRFTPDANRDAAATFTYVVVESGGELNSSESTGTISVTAVNDAPTGSNVSLPSINEDTSAPTGTAISTLFSGNFSDVDTGGSLGGILVVSNTTDIVAQGSWEYSSDGTNFFDIGAVADNGTALALSASTQLRFVPVADFNGTPPALTVRVVDETQTAYTSGGSRTTVDSSANGGSTAFAAATTTVGITITSVNDAPTITEAGAFTDIVEDQSPNNGVTVTSFLNGLVEDVDNTTGSIGLAITATDVSAMSGSGSDWQYSTNGGTNWNNVGTIASGSALLLSPAHLIRFTPSSDQAGSATLTYKAWDASTGTGGAVEVLSTGDTNRVSTASFTSSIAVTAVNDAPANLTTNTKTIEENTTYVLTSSDLAFTAKAGAPNEQSSEQIVFKLTSIPANGNIQREFGSTWVTLAIGGLFSQADINAGDVRYVHTGAELSANSSDTFGFSVRDGAGSVLNDTFDLTITNVNAPLSLTGTTISVNELIASTDVTVLNIGTSDADNADVSLIGFTLKSLPSATVGKLEIDKDDGNGFVDAAVNDTFTKTDLNNGKLRFVHSGIEPDGANASTTFTVDATDNSPAGINTTGNPSPSTVLNQTITLNVKPINDTPVNAINVPTVDEGQSVIIDENFLDFTDTDSANTQFTVILTSVPSHGSLSLNGVRLGIGSLILRSDLVGDKLVYQHFGGNPDSDANTIDDTFNFTMRDRDGAVINSSLGIKVNPITTDDTDTTGSGGGGAGLGNGANNVGEVILAEGGTHIVTDANLDRTNNGTNYVVTALPARGELKLNGATLVKDDTFTAADITANKLTYVHDDTENFTDVFKFTADSGVENTFNIVITPVNEAPVITTPNANEISITVNETDTGTAYVANTKDLTNADHAFLLTTTQLVGSDVDSPPNSDLFYELTGKPPGGEIKIWNATDSVYESLTKDRFTVQDLLDGKVAYFHTEGTELNSTTDKFTVKLTDGGATDSAPKTINITVSNTNDNPSTQGASFTVLEGGTQSLQTILNGKFTDADAGDTPDNLVLEITAIPLAATGSLKNGSTTLTVGSTFTKADLDAGNITYVHTGAETYTDSFSFKARDDEGLESTPDTVTVAVRPVNDDPTVSTNTGIVLGDNKYENETFTITAAQLAATDDDNSATQVQFRVTSSTSSGTLTVNGKVIGAGSVFTLDDVNKGLVKYQHTKEDTLTDAFTFTVSDSGGGNEPTSTFNIALNAVNDSPELVVPNAVSLLEEGVKTITGVVVSDVDAGTSDIVTTLTVTKGTITFANTSLGGGVVVIAGDGKSLTITGTVTEVNAMLTQGVQYTGAANEVGADTLTINVNDSGNTGIDPSDAALTGRDIAGVEKTGSATDQQVEKTVGITLLPVNDAPVITFTTTTATINEDASLNLSDLSFSDVDAGSTTVSVTLKVDAGSTTGGKITVNDTSGVTVTGNTSKSVTITGTLAAINAVLDKTNSLTYAAKDNFNGSDTLTVAISDLGNTGAGGAKSTTKTTAITISPINDAPDVSTAVSVSGNEDNNITVKLEAASLDQTGNPNSTITGFKVTVLPNAADGVLFKSDGTTQVAANALLTKAEAETLVFKPVANTNGATTFSYTATDGLLTSAVQTGTITVNAVNDTPGLAVVSTGVTYLEGNGVGVSGTAVDLTTGAVTVSDIELITTDEDSFNGARLEVDRDGGNNSTDVFSIDVVSNTAITLSNASNVNSTITIDGDIIGTITKNSSGQIRVTFSALAEQADVNIVAQAIYYQNTSDAPPTSVDLDFRFRDGNAGSAQGSGNIKQVETEVIVAITKSNDAPVGKNGSYTFAEDAATSPTFTLSEANILASDADSGSSVSYVAITGNAASANASTQGVWEYSTNSGTNWTNVGTVADNSAVVVPVGSLVRFVPVAHYNGVPGVLSFRAVDNSSADITGTGKDVSTNGGATAIDGTARTITPTITSVNDAPALAANQLSPTATESGGGTGLVALLNSTGTAIAATDVDATHFNGGSITVALDAYITGDGLSLTGTFGAAEGVASTTGGTASNFVITLNNNATLAQVNAMLAAIRYSYTGDNPTDTGNDPSRVYTIKLNDGGQSNGPSNTGTTGTAKDSNVLTGTITLQNQNDSPTGAAAALSVVEDTTNPAGTLVSSLSIFTDKDGDTFAGIAVSANSADATSEGVWQYASDGSTWLPIGTATNAASVVLQATSSIRFVPAANFTGNSADSLSVRVVDSSYSGAYSKSTPTTSTVTLNTSAGTGVEAFATAATAISINVTEVNDAPVFSDVGGTVAYTESAAVLGLGTAVLLDINATIADIELSGLDNIDDDDFGGATLTIERKTTANADDVFAVVAGNTVSLSGNDILITGSATPVATITSNTAGTMLITFAAGATDTKVESIMRQISFANKADQPPASVVVEYTFNDKNTGDQGTGNNLTGKAEVTVNITATNDTPVATPDTGAVTENSGTTTVSGNAITDATADSDADGNDLDISDITGPNGAKTDTDGNTTFTIPGTYGSLVINKETGAYVYTINNALAATQALDTNDAPIETFNYTVSDGTATAVSTIKITVNGANDAPIANPNTDVIVEDTATESGNLITDATADSDVDDTDLNITAITGPGAASTEASGNLTIVGTYGTLVTNKDTGAYTYTLDNTNTTVIALGVGESLTETFTYTLSDAEATDTSTLIMTINGRNDSPVGSAASLSVAEDTTNPSGTLISSLSNYTDKDGDAQKGIAVTANNANATTEGVWQYSSNSGTTWSAIGTATDAASVVLQTTSLIRFVPVANFTGNSADSLSVRVLDTTYSGTYSTAGSLVTLNTSAASTGVEAFAATATAISINVTEVNDAPVLSDIGGSVAYTESATVLGLGTAVLLDVNATIADIELSGLDNIDDDDFGGATLTIERKTSANSDDVFAVVTGNTVSLTGSNIVIATKTVATITSNTAGSMVITFAAGATDANVESVMRQISFANKADQPPASVVIEYTFNDKNTGDQGTGNNATGKAEVTVNITATNDTPVATPDTGAVTENSGTTTVSGNAITDATADSDADGNDLDVSNITGPNGAKTDTGGNTTFTIPGTYGSLVINKETGAYTYTINNTLSATQALDTGDAPVETFNYTISDGTVTATSTIKITVNGANDAPVANPNTGAINENSVSTTGNLITDATADSDVDDTNLDISGITTTKVGSTSSSAGGNLTIVGNFGTLVINEGTGAYTYSLDNTNTTVKALGVGQKTTETFTYTLTDGTDTDTSTLIMTINGQNNTPVATVDTASVTENSATTTATGNAITDATADSDIDGDDLDVSAITGPNGTSTDNTTTFSINGVYGTMVINKETGAYTYTLDNTKAATQALDTGDTPTEVFNYTINDGQNGTASSTITVTVTGANDAPVANANTKSITTDDTNVTGNLISDALADSDVDDTDLDITAVTGPNASTAGGGELTIAGDYGTLVINEGSGAYTYTLDKTDTAVLGLGSGDSITDTFTYTLSDGTDTDTSTLAVTVTLNNVDPVANADTSSIAEDDASVSGNALTGDTDGDGDDLDVTGITGPNGAAVDGGGSFTIAGIYGTLEIDKETGAYTYTLDNTKTITQTLDTGDSPSEVFNYAINDGQGGSSASTISISITGVNDIPTASDTVSNRVNLDATEGVNLNIASLAGFKDADDTLAYSAINLPTGLSISAVGVITGTIDKNASQGGTSGVYSVTVTAKDDDGASVDVSFDWVVSNPAPVARANAGSVMEDGSIASAGNLITDTTADSDPDGDDLSISAISGSVGAVTDNGATLSVSGTYGTLIVTKSTGGYQYTLNNTSDGVDALDKGDSVTDVFSYTLSDSDRGVSTSSLVITVNGANDAPTVATPIEDTTISAIDVFSLDVSGNFDDVDADDTRTYSASGLPSGVTINADSGKITGTPTEGSSKGGPASDGIFVATVTATDANGLTVSDTFTLTMGNAPPKAVADSTTATEDSGPVSGDLILGAGGDSDADGDDLVVTSVSGPGGGGSDNGSSFSVEGIYGTLTVNKATGSYTYTVDNTREATQGLDKGDNPTEVFNYSISDGEDGSASSSLTVTVNGANDAPTVATPIADTNISGTDPVSLDVSGNFADVDVDDTHTYAVSGLPGGLTIDPASGEITGTPAIGSGAGGSEGDGLYSVTVTVTDVNGLAVTDTFTLKVGNAPPKAVDDFVSTTEDTGPVSGDLILNAGGDTDAEGDDLVVTSVSGPSGPGSDNGSGFSVNGVYGTLTVNKATGSYTYTLDNTRAATQDLDAGDSPTEVFNYSISDGQGGTASASLTVTVNGANDAPTVATPIADASISATGPVSLDVSANFADVDADDNQTYSASGLPGGLTIDPATGEIAGTPAAGSGTGGPGSDGVYTVTVTVTDVNGLPVTDTFSLTVGNAPPVAVADSVSTTEDTGPVSGDLILGAGGDTDPDGDDLAVTSVSGPGGAASDNGSNFSVDGIYGTLTVNKATGSYTYTLDNTREATQGLDEGDAPTEVFNYSISDGKGGTASASLTVTVNGANDAPTVATPIADTSISATGPVSLDVSANFADVDADDNQTYSVSGLPDGLTIDPATGEITGTPAAGSGTGGPGSDGVYTVTVTVTDVNGLPVTDTFSLTVGNLPPVAVADIVSATEDTGPVSGDLILGAGGDTDPDGDDLVVTSISGPGGVVSDNGSSFSVDGIYGTLTVNKATGSYTYTIDNTRAATQGLDSGDAPTEVFNYSISDGQGGTASASLTVIVNGANDAPTVVAPIADIDVSASGPVLLDISGSFADVDVDDTRTYTASGLPGGLTIDPVSGEITGTPAAGSVNGGPASDGIFTVIVTATDVNDLPVSDTFTLTVGNGNAPPVGQSAAFGLTAGGGPFSGVVVGIDPDGDAIVSFNLISNVDSGILTFDNNGNFVFDENGAFNDLADGVSRTVSFTYTVTDVNGAVSEVATISITVIGIENVIIPGVDPGTIPEIIPPIFIDPAVGEVPVTDNSTPVTGTGGGTGAPSGGGVGGGAAGGPTGNLNPSNPVVTNLNLNLGAAGNAPVFQLSLTLTLEDQLVTTRGTNLFSLPANAFDNGGSSPIGVEVVLSNGSALPDFVVFNADDLSFTIDGIAAGEAGVEEIIIRVTGSDSNGNSASGTFIIVIVEGEASDAEPVDPNQTLQVVPVNNDQGLILLDESDAEIAARLEGIGEAPNNENVEKSPPSFFDKLDVAANEDNFENKVKQLLDDIVELIS